jgi:hypothetical protein
MSARVIAFPLPVPGTDVALVGQLGNRVLLSAPGPDGRRRTVHGRPPEGVSNALCNAGRAGRLRFSGPWWNRAIEVVPLPPKPPGRF